MGANDDILAEGGPDAASAEKPAAVDNSAAVTKAISDGFTQFGTQLGQHTAEIQRYVQATLAGAQQRVEQGAGSRSDNDLTQQLLSDPEKAITSVLDRWAQTNLAPALTAQAESQYEDHLDRQRTTIDAKWGPGAFDEVLLPEIRAVVDKTPNAAAKSTRNYINTLTQLAVGKDTNLTKLMERQAKWNTEKAKGDDVGSDGVLDAGRRRPARSAGALTDEDRNFMARVSDATGAEINLKRIEEIKRVLDKDGYLDSQNMPGVKNKLPVKGARYSQKGATA